VAEANCVVLHPNIHRGGPSYVAAATAAATVVAAAAATLLIEKNSSRVNFDLAPASPT
jgi:hypothetical protein